MQLSMEGSNMLQIFICPKCFNYRIVSRKPEAFCFHCGVKLFNSGIGYNEYTEMSEKERERYKQRFINRMLRYQDKIASMFKEEDTDK